MSKSNNRFSLKILGFAVVFFVMNFALYAQNRETPPSDPSSIDNPVTAQDTAFNSFAAQSAMNLAQQTGLSSDKAEKIRQILIDYHNNIVSTRQDFLRGKMDSRTPGAAGNTDRNGSNSDNNGNNSNSGNNSDVTGGQTGNNQANIDQDMRSEFQKQDMKADKDILGVFDNDSQKSKYVQVKRQWWDDVKNRVFSATNETSGENQKLLGGQQQTR